MNKQFLPISLSEVEILRRFSHMEKHFPRCNGKRYFPSLNFYLNFYDDPMGALKVEAENMLAFVGLGAYNATIHVDNLSGAAGFIRLRDEMNADITLDVEVYKDVNKVMSTLAHEICHKVLHKNGIFFDEKQDIENEIYADLATFYVGFGYFTMRGHQFSKKIKTQSSISIQTIKYGYLTPETYAIAYAIINAVNGDIDNSDYKDLPDHAKKHYSIAKSSDFIKALKALSIDTLTKKFSESSSILARTKLLYDNMQSILSENGKVLNEKYKDLTNVFYGFKDERLFEWNKMNIAYQLALNTCYSALELKQLKELQKTLLYSLDQMYNGGYIKNMKPVTFAVSSCCPICGQKINKILEPKSYHFICPQCKSHFVIDNDYNDVLSCICQQGNNRHNEKKALEEIPKIVEERDTLKDKLNIIENKWWYKLFHKL